jgi:hypothetical protein
MPLISFINIFKALGNLMSLLTDFLVQVVSQKASQDAKIADQAQQIADLNVKLANVAAADPATADEIAQLKQAAVDAQGKADEATTVAQETQAKLDALTASEAQEEADEETAIKNATATLGLGEAPAPVATPVVDPTAPAPVATPTTPAVDPAPVATPVVDPTAPAPVPGA